MIYKIRLSEEQINTILFGLQKLPWERVNPLISDIVKQAERQNTVKESPKKKDL